MSARTYQRLDRNIVFCDASIKVMIFRNRKVIYSGAQPDLNAARARRDALERRHPARLPWDLTAKKPFRRTQTMLRQERRAAGLCQMCGAEPASPGLLSCASCRHLIKVKACARQEVAA